jgi:hypothetical protein
MLVTRIGYGLIILVMAAAVAAIALVLRPEEATQPPMIEFQQVVNYSRYGVIDRIDAHGKTLTVHFKDDFDTAEPFQTSVHTFEAGVPDGRDIMSALTSAGVPVNGSGGLQVTSH